MNNKEQYDVANLSEKEIDRLHSLEEMLSANKEEEVILIAYKEERSPKHTM